MEKLYVILMYVGLELQLCLLYGLCFPEWFCYLVINGGLNLAHFSGLGCTQMGYGITATSLPHIIATSSPSQLPRHHHVSCHVIAISAATSSQHQLPCHCHVSCHIIATLTAMSFMSDMAIKYVTFIFVINDGPGLRWVGLDYFMTVLNRHGLSNLW